MAKHTLKVLRCLKCKFLKYVWPFFNIMHERVKQDFVKMAEKCQQDGSNRDTTILCEVCLHQVMINQALTNFLRAIFPC